MPHGFALALAFAIALADEPFAFQVLKHSFEVGLLLGGRCRFAVVVSSIGVIGGRDEVRDAIAVFELLVQVRDGRLGLHCIFLCLGQN